MKAAFEKEVTPQKFILTKDLENLHFHHPAVTLVTPLSDIYCQTPEILEMRGPGDSARKFVNGEIANAEM